MISYLSFLFLSNTKLHDEIFSSNYVTSPLIILPRLSVAHQVRLAFKAPRDLVLVYSTWYPPFHSPGKLFFYPG